MAVQTESVDMGAPAPVGEAAGSALEDAAKKYANAERLRKQWKAKGDELRVGLVDAMKKLGRETYSAHGIKIELTHKEGVLVEVSKPDDESDD